MLTRSLSLATSHNSEYAKWPFGISPLRCEIPSATSLIPKPLCEITSYPLLKYMNINKSKEIIKIIKNEPISVLIIFSLLILPIIYLEWVYFFPSYQTLIIIVITLLWVFALYKVRLELKIYRRKIILQNYLIKRKRASFIHLSKEWDAKEEFTEKNTNKLLLEYPDVFKRVKVKRGNEYYKGVGLIADSTEVKNETSDDEKSDS